MIAKIDELPVKIFSVGDNRKFLYEAVTNKIFKVENNNSLADKDLISALASDKKISSDILATPKYSASFAEYCQVLKNRLPRLILEVTRQCNMRCSYCVYSGKFSGRRNHQNFKMSRKVLERAIDFYAEHSRDLGTGNISFYGGEALLCADEVFHAVEYATCAMPKKKLSFTISTNGLLLDKNIYHKLTEYPNVFLNITLNGSPHDKYRRSVEGKGTLKIILHNLDELKKDFLDVWENQVGFICNYATFEELMAQRNFYLNVVKKMPLLINPIVPPNFSEMLSMIPEKISAREKIMEVYLAEGDEFLESFFKVSLAVIHERPIFPHDSKTFINSCIPLSNGVFVTADGDFQICTETTDLSALGNVNCGYNFGTLKTFYDAIEKSFEESNCRKCWAQRLCYACCKDFITDKGKVQPITKNYCEKIRADILSDLMLYCRIVYDYPAIAKRILKKS